MSALAVSRTGRRPFSRCTTSTVMDPALRVDKKTATQQLINRSPRFHRREPMRAHPGSPGLASHLPTTTSFPVPTAVPT
jgi:hypothetical protein